ncbi:DinB family protein [Cesiribacter sp. SM1]|uniref:DinB family protein n=1 Tax=Cesiribacter sp. SM1 TaxID=2861196 RepID=UPI001CD5F85F|nr:DinB family protein [Cesiribacter sp. SM1]
MKQIRWFDRSFQFGATQNIFPAVLERLAGTPVRLEEKCMLIPHELLAKGLEGKWSIKENVGHLIDLEPLWQGRLHDILNGREELRPADLQNTLTTQANHNAVLLEDLLSSFRQVRKQTLQLLEPLKEEDVFKAALHPRLKIPMRTMDLFLFVAEHDDHHLARITELAKVIDKQI